VQHDPKILQPSHHRHRSLLLIILC
jgi:hypothetical protein